MLNLLLFAVVTDRLTDEVRQQSFWIMMSLDSKQKEESLERGRYALGRREGQANRSGTGCTFIKKLKKRGGTGKLPGLEE